MWRKAPRERETGSGPRVQSWRVSASTEWVEKEEHVINRRKVQRCLETQERAVSWKPRKWKVSTGRDDDMQQSELVR